MSVLLICPILLQAEQVWKPDIYFTLNLVIWFPAIAPSRSDDRHRAPDPVDTSSGIYIMHLELASSRAYLRMISMSSVMVEVSLTFLYDPHSCTVEFTICLYGLLV